MIIEPKDDKHISLDNMLQFTKDFLDAEKIEMDIDNKNLYSLFTFGILFSYMHYEDYLKKNDSLVNIQDKRIIPSKDIIQTPEKTFYNVLFDIVNKQFTPLADYDINSNQGYLISPVHGVDLDAKEKLSQYRDKLSNDLSIPKIHLPILDTDQIDSRGTRICRDNLDATANARSELLFYSPTSRGSVFDIGMWFILDNFIDKHIAPEEKRDFIILNPNDLDKSKPYDKLVLTLADNSNTKNRHK